MPSSDISSCFNFLLLLAADVCDFLFLSSFSLISVALLLAANLADFLFMSSFYFFLAALLLAANLDDFLFLSSVSFFEVMLRFAFSNSFSGSRFVIGVSGKSFLFSISL